jgi:ribonuclease PH
MLRKDLRGANDLRPFTVELGLVSEANGSAAVSTGGTKVIASVVGPTQPKYSRHELYDKAAIEVDVQIPAKTVVNGCDIMQQKKKLQSLLLNAVEGCIDTKQFPRMLILFNVLVVSNDGGMIATAANSCILALLDAGIPMLHVPTAISMALTSPGSAPSPQPSIMQDPTLEEESDSSAIYTVVMRPLHPIRADEAAASTATVSDTCVVTMDMVGLMSVADLKEVHVAAVQTTQYLRATMRKFLEAKLLNNA